MCDECKQGFGLCHREGLEKTLTFVCDKCLFTSTSFKKFKDHWFDKHFKENFGCAYTYKFKVATIRMGNL